MTDSDYWNGVINGTIPYDHNNPAPTASLLTANTTGVRLAPTSTINAWLPVVSKSVVPESGQLYFQCVVDAAYELRLYWYDAADAPLSYLYVTKDGLQPAPAAAVYYRCAFLGRASTSGNYKVISARVFEVMGASAGQQRAELSPAGLRLVSDDGSGAVNLTTSTDMFLSIQKNTGLGFETQAAIDQDGTGTFNTVVSNGDFNALGSDVVGGFAEAVINGQVRDGALFDNIPWGGVLEADCGADGYAGTAERIAIGSGTVDLSADRQYVFEIAWRLFIRYTAGTGLGSPYLRIFVSTNPINISAPTQSGGFEYEQPLLWSTSDAIGSATTIATNDGVACPAFTPPTGGTYYVLALIGNDSARTLYFQPSSGTTLRISDVGAAANTLSVGSWATRATSGTVTPPTPPSRTIQRAMNWSRAWNNSGSSIVTGTTQYYDRAMLYQGVGSTAYGARAGWPALGISGHTITACSVWLQNRHTESSAGVTAHLGFGGNGSAPATFGSRTGAFDVGFSKGQGKWVSVPRAYWASIAAGAYRDLSIGVSSGGSDYSYFDGVGKASPPQIRITYR